MNNMQRMLISEILSHIGETVKIFGKVVPVTDSPDGTARAIGVAIAQRLKMLEYDPERMICRGTYGGILTGVMPRSFNDIEKKVLELIDPENGDSMLLVCSLR
jgi:hypothetical protein